MCTLQYVDGTRLVLNFTKVFDLMYNKYASCPDWPISPHADCRHRKRLQHWPSPSKRRHVSHMVRDGRASLSHRANDRRCVIDFSIFDLAGLLWSKGHKKGRRPTIHLDLKSYKIAARSRKRSTRYALPNYFTFWPLGG